MKLFGFEIKRQREIPPLTTETKTSISPVTVSDWLKNNKHPRASFYLKLWSKEKLIECTVYCDHHDNSIDAKGSGPTADSAFHAAVKQIEKTIGGGWRQ